jgi:hypothetical protein
VPAYNKEDHIPIRPLPRATVTKYVIPAGTEALSNDNLNTLITACYIVLGLVERTDYDNDLLEEFFTTNEDLWFGLSNKDEDSGLVIFPGIDVIAEFIGRTGDLSGRILDKFQFGLRQFQVSYEVYANAIPQVTTLLKSMRSYLSTRDSKYRLALDKFAAESSMPAWVEKMFDIDYVDDQEPIQERLMEIIHEWNGEDSLYIKSFAELAEFKAKKPELYKEFEKVNREFTNSWMTYVAAFVRESGEKMVSYKELLDEMEENGYESDLPIGFDGYIDAACNWYTKDKKKIYGRVRKSITPIVIMNKGDTKNVFKVADWNGNVQSVGAKTTYYTVEHHNESSAKKFAAVKDFSSVAESIRGRWLRELTGASNGAGNKVFAPSDVNQVTALVIEMVWQTAARIGNPENSTDGEQTYGLSTVKVNQARFSPNSVTITYAGKDAVSTKHVIKAVDPLTTYIVNALKVLATFGNKKRTDYLFTYVTKQGNQRRLSDHLVNKELKGFYSVPSGFSIHNIRTYHGTKIFEDQLEAVFKKYPKLTKKGATELIKSLATEVGRKLNHVRRTGGEDEITPTTALNNYIDFNAQARFYQHYSIPLPAYLAKKLRIGLTASPFLEQDAFEPAIEGIDEDFESEAVASQEEALREDTAPVLMGEDQLSEEEAPSEDVQEEQEDMAPDSEDSAAEEEQAEDPGISEGSSEEDAEADKTEQPAEEEGKDAETKAEEELAKSVKEELVKEKVELEKTRELTPMSEFTEQLLMQTGSH